jgi:hypothetical protein
VKLTADGKVGILKSIQEFTYNERVLGYIDDIVIQPMAHYKKQRRGFCYFVLGRYAVPYRDPQKTVRYRSLLSSIMHDVNALESLMGDEEIDELAEQWLTTIPFRWLKN